METKKFKKANQQPFFKEFVLEYLGDMASFNENLLKNNILNGLDLGENKLLLCATETKTIKDMEAYLKVLEGENV